MLQPILDGLLPAAVVGPAAAKTTEASLGRSTCPTMRGQDHREFHSPTDDSRCLLARRLQAPLLVRRKSRYFDKILVSNHLGLAPSGSWITKAWRARTAPPMTRSAAAGGTRYLALHTKFAYGRGAQYGLRYRYDPSGHASSGTVTRGPLHCAHWLALSSIANFHTSNGFASSNTPPATNEWQRRAHVSSLH